MNVQITASSIRRRLLAKCVQFVAVVFIVPQSKVIYWKKVPGDMVVAKSDEQVTLRELGTRHDWFCGKIEQL